jgi:hypothetical protein
MSHVCLGFEVAASASGGGSRAQAGKASAKVDDDDAAVRIVLFSVRDAPPSRVAIEGELEVGLDLLTSLTLLLLTLPYLLDDERRKHQVLPLSSTPSVTLSSGALS